MTSSLFVYMSHGEGNLSVFHSINATLISRGHLSNFTFLVVICKFAQNIENSKIGLQYHQIGPFCQKYTTCTTYVKGLLISKEKKRSEGFYNFFYRYVFVAQLLSVVNRKSKYCYRIGKSNRLYVLRSGIRVRR